MDWTLYSKDYQKCNIHTFDDGNHSYQYYENEWYIIGTNNKGKYRLKNVTEEVIIDSISAWKVTMY